MANRNIAILTNIPAPYRIPTFNCLGRLAGGEFHVVFSALTESNRSWVFRPEGLDFQWTLLSEGAGETGVLSILRSTGKMLAFLLRRRPSAVICGGYHSLAAWVVFFWCKLFRRRFVLWVESTARDARAQGVFRSCRGRMKRLIVSGADAVAASGAASAEYMKTMGAREERIYRALFAGDPGAFRSEAAKVCAPLEKRGRGFPDQLILYSGRLVRAKGVFVLLEAFRQVAQELPDVGLLVVGHGPEGNAMEKMCQNANLARVFFEGPQEYQRMPYYYALADVLALPTFSDPWGFVVNEAFACGVPAIVSRVAGVCVDLIVDGETGFGIEPGDARGLAEKLLLVLRDPSMRSRMGANCWRLIESYSAEACARGLFAAATGQPRSPVPAGIRAELGQGQSAVL